jgi:hypothetical protein
MDPSGDDEEHMSDYRVSTVSPEEAEELLRRLRAGGPTNKNARRSAILQGGIEMKGSFELIARDAKSGEIEWAHAADNLITDFGRRAWMDMRFYNLQIGFGASTETPTAARSALPGDSTQLFGSGNLTPSNNSVTNTKTLSTTFGTPANNRTLGTIWINRLNDGFLTGYHPGILAYALLTPPKTQTTTQTLEVVYKISISPIY